MLYIIGLGLDKGDLNQRALKVIKKCKVIYLECYTSSLPYKINELEKVIGEKIATVERDFVEDAVTLLKQAKKKNVALLVYGDPLIATTHISLLIEAKKQKVKVEVLHNISVLNAITETGLEAYKFGKVTSIPKWQEKENYQPKSFYSVLKQNLQIGAHTLLLLDNELSLQEAISYLLQISKEQGGSFSEKTLCVACSCLGTAKQKIAYGEAKKIARLNLNKPHCLIVPAKLHFVEAEFLKRFKVK